MTTTKQNKELDRSVIIEILAVYYTEVADIDEFYKTMGCEWNGGEFDEKELRREYYQCELERLADLTDAELIIEFRDAD